MTWKRAFQNLAGVGLTSLVAVNPLAHPVHLILPPLVAGTAPPSVSKRQESPAKEPLHMVGSYGGTLISTASCYAFVSVPSFRAQYAFLEVSYDRVSAYINAVEPATLTWDAHRSA